LPENASRLAAFNTTIASKKGGRTHLFEDQAGLVDFTWHDLRHTFASRLVMADVDIRTVAELMGHKKIQMKMRYAHLAPEHKLVAVERLKAYIPYIRTSQKAGSL
jgi:integrase